MRSMLRFGSGPAGRALRRWIPILVMLAAILPPTSSEAHASRTAGCKQGGCPAVQPATTQPSTVSSRAAGSTAAPNTTLDVADGYIQVQAPNNLRIIGPSYSTTIQAGDNSASQFFSPGFGSVMLDAGARLNLTVLDTNGNRGTYTAIVTPSTYVAKDGRVYLKGSGYLGSGSREPLAIKYYPSGSSIGNLQYWVAEVTNLDTQDVHLTIDMTQGPTNFTNGRYQNVGNGSGDNFVIDAANSYLRINDTGIANMYIGMKPLNTPTRHFQVSSSWMDDSSYISTNHKLSDTVSQSSSGYGDYVYLQSGDLASGSASTTTITPGATATFAWAIGYATTQAALTTLMNGSDAQFGSDLGAYRALAANTVMTVTTPYASFNYLLESMMRTELYSSKLMQVHGYQAPPAGAYTFFTPFARDGYYAALSNGQAGNTSSIRDQFNLFRSIENANHSQQHEAGYYVNSNGMYFAYGNNGSPGDQDMYQILEAYEYYVRTGDKPFLTANISYLDNIGDYLVGYYNTNISTDGLFESAGCATYLDGNGNLTGRSPVVDPIMNALFAYTMNRLSELNAITGDTSRASTYAAVATKITQNYSKLFLPSTNWLLFNRTPDGLTTYSNEALTKIDALIFDALTDTTEQQAMVTNVLGATWWDSTNEAFYETPTNDSLFSPGSYWYGPGWNLTDYKAFSAIFRYGTTAQAQAAWSRLQLHTDRVIASQYGNPGEHSGDNGLFDFSLSAVEMVTRGLFGIDAHSTYLTASPNTWKIGAGSTWSLSNYTAGGHYYSFTVSGDGPQQTTYLDGVLQSSNRLYYDGSDHTVAIVMSATTISPTPTAASASATPTTTLASSTPTAGSASSTPTVPPASPTPTSVPVSPTPTATAAGGIVTLGGLNLDGFCRAQGLGSNASLVNGVWYCSSTRIDMVSACKWQYPSAQNVTAAEAQNGNAYTWTCYGGAVASSPTPTAATPSGTATSTPTGSAQRVTSFGLYNATTNQPIAGYNPLLSGSTISLSALPSTHLNINAVTSPAMVGSVVFGVDGNANYHTENYTPYFLAGKSGGYWIPSIGTHTISATPFTGSQGSGARGLPSTLVITFAQ